MWNYIIKFLKSISGMNTFFCLVLTSLKICDLYKGGHLIPLFDATSFFFPQEVGPLILFFLYGIFFFSSGSRSPDSLRPLRHFFFLQKVGPLIFLLPLRHLFFSSGSTSPDSLLSLRHLFSSSESRSSDFLLPFTASFFFFLRK